MPKEPHSAGAFSSATGNDKSEDSAPEPILHKLPIAPWLNQIARQRGRRPHLREFGRSELNFYFLDDRLASSLTSIRRIEKECSQRVFKGRGTSASDNLWLHNKIPKRSRLKQERWDVSREHFALFSAAKALAANAVQPSSRFLYFRQAFCCRCSNSGTPRLCARG